MLIADRTFLIKTCCCNRSRSAKDEKEEDEEQLDIDELPKISLAYKQLTSLAPSIFSGLDRLVKIDLEGNQLSTLPVNLFPDFDRLFRKTRQMVKKKRKKKF
jgi:Leucine-rich repeat (LRR) protein